MSELSLERLIKEKIRDIIAEEIGNLDIGSIAQSIAERAIENEIGDITDEAADYIYDQAGDWQGKYGADDIMKEIIDETYFT